MYFKRGKRKIIADYTSKDIYEFYKEKYGEKALNKKHFTTIWNRFIDIRLQMVIYENVQFTMPYRLGDLSIRLGGQANRITKAGKFNFKTHWGKTKQKWKELYPNLTSEEIKNIENKPLVYVSNDSTDGKKVHWRWDKITCNYKNHSLYRIRMTRKWSRMLSEYTQKVDSVPYYETAPWSKTKT